MIVTATSGDTGKAALAGFADAPGCGITVFYPEGKVSRVQELQMSTQEGANVSVCAVRGNFDDAQSAVKRIFADRELAARLAAVRAFSSPAPTPSTSAAWCPRSSTTSPPTPSCCATAPSRRATPWSSACPPATSATYLAGYYAKRLGLPVAKLIVASDKNNVLFDFLTTGTYDRERPFYTTTSPSMDILISSNLERMLYYLADGDCELVAGLMADLAGSLHGARRAARPHPGGLRLRLGGRGRGGRGHQGLLGAPWLPHRPAHRLRLPRAAAGRSRAGRPRPRRRSPPRARTSSRAPSPTGSACSARPTTSPA